MSALDNIRRECIDVGTSLAKDDTSGARKAIAAIQTKAEGDKADVTALAKELAEFRTKYNVSEKVTHYA